MNLWPVEQIFPHISADPDKKWGQKCSSDQWFICTKLTSYKIHIFALLQNVLTHLSSAAGDQN